MSGTWGRNGASSTDDVLSLKNNLVDRTLKGIGSGMDGDSKSPGDMLECSNNCAEGQRVQRGGRLPHGKIVNRAGGDADAASEGLGLMLEGAAVFFMRNIVQGY